MCTVILVLASSTISTLPVAHVLPMASHVVVAAICFLPRRLRGVPSLRASHPFVPLNFAEVSPSTHIALFSSCLGQIVEVVSFSQGVERGSQFWLHLLHLFPQNLALTSQVHPSYRGTDFSLLDLHPHGPATKMGHKYNNA